ncbi:MAG TPA: FkbM family methyltransferase [bacterium]|nr:FkbM family methyltransferase [bacterium]
MKADIEGAERLMLKGAEQTIRRFKPSIAIRIYHLPDDPEVIEAMLKEFVPEYKIEKFGRKTLYAYLEK